jgi:hypothetical protein
MDVLVDLSLTFRSTFVLFRALFDLHVILLIIALRLTLKKPCVAGTLDVGVRG